MYTELDKSFFYIIDLLASEYGWSIEYIQNLTMPEITGLIKAIIERKNIEDQRQQLNIIKALSGKISPNYYVKKDKKLSAEEEVKNFEQLKKLLQQLEGGKK